MLSIFTCRIHAGDIKPSVEVEFNIFYNRNYPQPLSFQFREAKLFLDTYINEHSTALIEYTIKDDLVRGELERAYFIQHDLPWSSQLTFGQFRNPFGYYDPFTVTHSLTKNTELAAASPMPKFKLRDLDVGLLWESFADPLSVSLAVVNGNGINNVRDDNNFKDVIGHVSYSFDRFQVGANGYYGRKNSINPDGSAGGYANVEVSAVGFETMMLFDQAVVALEVVARQYGALNSAGAYTMINYDLGSLVSTLRTTMRLEFFDPDRSAICDERVQYAQGVLYTISRGYLAKLEGVVNLERYRKESNQIFFELEYEL